MKRKGITAIDGKLSDRARRLKRLAAAETDPGVLTQISFNCVRSNFDKMPNDRVRRDRMEDLFAMLRAYVERAQ